MAANMQLAIKSYFVNAHRVIDRFHVQKLAYDAVQECRIKYRWEALDQENREIAAAKQQKVTFRAEILSNGDCFQIDPGTLPFDPELLYEQEYKCLSRII